MVQFPAGYNNGFLGPYEKGDLKEGDSLTSTVDLELKVPIHWDPVPGRTAF